MSTVKTGIVNRDDGFRDVRSRRTPYAVRLVSVDVFFSHVRPLPQEAAGNGMAGRSTILPEPGVRLLPAQEMLLAQKKS